MALHQQPLLQRALQGRVRRMGLLKQGASWCKHYEACLKSQSCASIGKAEGEHVFLQRGRGPKS